MADSNSGLIVCRCKYPHKCVYCTCIIRKGQKHALDFDTQCWVHVFCLVQHIQFKEKFRAHAPAA